MLLNHLKYGMKTYDLVDTPMVEKSKLDEDPQGKAVDPTRYCRMIGTLMYFTFTFADADHAGFQDTKRSTSGSMQLLGDRLVSWYSKKQKSTIISSAEAEYITLSGCSKLPTSTNVRYHGELPRSKDIETAGSLRPETDQLKPKM
ncbi:hypothetical protein Tco_0740242 [Tanacetum coccineum]